jgi:hypothetical protein
MVNTFNRFTTREILGLFIPGLYFSYMIFEKFSTSFSFELNNDTTSFNYLVLFIVSISIGCILYVIDLPKRVWFFTNELPITLIKQKLIKDGKTIDDVNVEIFYYNFYDKEVSEKNKSNTDKQTTLYHFSTNMVLCGLIILLIQVISGSFTLDNGLIIVNIAIIIMGVIGLLGLLYGKDKMRSYFQRHYTEFIDSEYYTKLKDK